MRPTTTELLEERSGLADPERTKMHVAVGESQRQLDRAAAFQIGRLADQRDAGGKPRPAPVRARPLPSPGASLSSAPSAAPSRSLAALPGRVS